MGEYHNSAKPQIIQKIICSFSVEKKKNGQCRAQQMIPRVMHWAKTHDGLIPALTCKTMIGEWLIWGPI